MPRAIWLTPFVVFRKRSSSGVDIKPSSIRQLGIEVSRNTRNPACFTPLSIRPAVAQVRFWTYFAKSTLCAML